MRGFILNYIASNYYYKNVIHMTGFEVYIRKIDIKVSTKAYVIYPNASAINKVTNIRISL